MNQMLLISYGYYAIEVSGIDDIAQLVMVCYIQYKKADRERQTLFVLADS